MIRNIIFDFDGTLADTAPLILATMRDSIAALGLPPRSDDECRASIGLRLVEIPAFLWPGSDAGLGQRYADTYHRLFDENKVRMRVGCFPGVADTLQALHARGLRMAIATSRGHRSVMEYAAEFGLAAMFAMYVGAEDVKRGKPAPDPVLMILDTMGWSAAETLVVGDADVDIMMGRAAGTKTCAVTYGNGSPGELEAVHPDVMIDSFPGLPGALAALVP